MADDFKMEEIEDQFGVIRRMGSMPGFAPANSGLVQFSKAFKLWTVDECRKAIGLKTARADELFPGEGEEDQHSHGSCGGYAAANASWRSAYAGGNTKLTKRSGSYAYSLANHNADNGSALYEVWQQIQIYGIPSLASCGWDLIYRSQTQKFDGEAKLFIPDNPLLVSEWDEFLTAAAGPFNLVVALQVGRNFERLTGDMLGVDQGPGNHAVCQDDVRLTDAGGFQFKIIMDWGLRHGVQGCGWVDERHLRDKMQYHQFYAFPYGQWGNDPRNQ